MFMGFFEDEGLVGRRRNRQGCVACWSVLLYKQRDRAGIPCGVHQEAAKMQL
jgi:hypothetical protein